MSKVIFRRPRPRAGGRSDAGCGGPSDNAPWLRLTPASGRPAAAGC
jgi:hypothetical protein